MSDHAREPRDLAMAVLEDSVVVKEIGDAEGEDEIEERVREAYSDKTRELQEQAAEAARLAAEERAAREAAEAARATRTATSPRRPVGGKGSRATGRLTFRGVGRRGEVVDERQGLC